MRRRAGRDLSDEEVFKTFIKVANYSMRACPQFVLHADAA